MKTFDAAINAGTHAQRGEADPSGNRGRRWMGHARGLILSILLTFAAAGTASASQAYGSINNFDCVNDTGTEAHGFEIELDDGRTTGVTYTYDYNHYGVPKITEDLTDPNHPKVFVRYSSAKNPDGTWAAYTAIPSGPISPTMGHQFTNPAVNFGGEHFGVGFIGTPTAVKYNWLVDDGSGKLIHGPAVYISTPSFTYVPPAGGNAGNVEAAIVPPPPPAPPALEFGSASWVKEIKTTSHNPNKVSLNQLVGDDPGKPQPWANGETPEVEMEWRVMQTDFKNANGGKNGELKGAPEGLPGGNEMITRRYEFYKYVGPYDAETGEAMGDTVGPDGIHGVGTVTYADHFDNATGEWVTVTVDLTKVVVVGDFFGTQMAGFDVAPNLGLIDHVQDGDSNTAYPARTVVVGGTLAFLATIKTGSLPPGLTLNQVTGVLSGTPTAGGTYTFTVEATDLGGADLTKAYTMNISGPGSISYTVATSALPVADGTTTGSGTFASGASVTVTATSNAGFAFVNWTEGGNSVSSTPSYTFQLTANRTLVANFANIYTVTTAASPTTEGTVTGSGSFTSGNSVTVSANAKNGYAFANWTEGSKVVSTSAAYTFVIAGNRTLTANFVKAYTVLTSASPAVAGKTSGDGSYGSGSSVTVSAVANADYVFVNWKVGASILSTSPTYTFTISANRTLLATFAKAYTIATSANPTPGGATTGDGTYKTGSKVKVLATANAGYLFVNWTEGTKAVSTSASYSFTASANRTLVANFVKTYVVSTSALPAADGTTTGSGTFKTGAKVTVKAAAKSGFKFVNWTEGTSIVGTATTYSFTISANRALVANFAKK